MRKECVQERRSIRRSNRTTMIEWIALDWMKVLSFNLIYITYGKIYVLLYLSK